MPKIYQPQTKNQETPQGLFSWQVFRTEEQARQWLIENADPCEQYDIIAYDDTDIEDYKFVESEFSGRATELEKELWKLRDKEIDLITDCMREKKTLFGFSDFDKEELMINDDVYFESDYFEMGTICPYCTSTDVYFIGMEYIETPEDKHNPYRINVYYVEEDCATIGVTDLSNVLADSRCVLVSLIKNYA